jgi:hypothetical protein
MGMNTQEARAEAKAAKARAKAMRPWYRKKRFWLLGIIVLLIIIGIAASASGGKGSPSPTTAASVATTTTSSTSTTAPTTTSAPTTTAPPTPKVLLTTSGSGIQTTTKFTTPTTWTLNWSYTCSTAGTDSGNFIVTVNGATTDGGVNELGAGSSGVQHFHQGGNVYLGINSECSWTIKAVTAT